MQIRAWLTGKSAKHILGNASTEIYLKELKPTLSFGNIMDGDLAVSLGGRTKFPRTKFPNDLFYEKFDFAMKSFCSDDLL